jgi:hypothetical protein
MKIRSIAVVLLLLLPIQAMAVVYDEDFVQGQSYTTSTPEGIAWTAFSAEVGAGAAAGIFTEVRLSGSNDRVGISCRNSIAVNELGVALANLGASTVVQCDGNTWRVGPCNDQEISVNTGGICGCPVGYTLRPTIRNPNWGGINTATCGGPSQSIRLEFSEGTFEPVPFISNLGLVLLASLLLLIGVRVRRAS